MKKTLYAYDVTHSCGHTVRYEFTIKKNFTQEAVSIELKKMADEPCGQCQKNKNVESVA